MPKNPRDYKEEYKTYHGKQDQIDNRNNRNKARRKLIKDGAISKGSPKEVDHKDGNPKNNSRKNLKAISRKANREKH